jgi:DsbC/DsbD-like thiol-disulfide interchange protein
VAGQGAAGIGPGPAPELGVRVERSGGEPDALILQVPRGWRLYAPDPGEAGLPLRLDWLLEGPRGTERTAPVAADYPDPDVGTSGGLLVRSYTGTVRVSLTPPRGALQPDAVRVGWALCRADLCVPGVSDVRWAGPRGDR